MRVVECRHLSENPALIHLVLLSIKEEKELRGNVFGALLYKWVCGYSTALKLISRLLTECVSAPTEIKSTPHSA